MLEDLPSWVSATTWTRGRAGSPPGGTNENGVTWFHVDTERLAPGAFFAALETRCEGLTETLVSELLTVEEAQSLSRGAGHQRAVAAFGVLPVNLDIEASSPPSVGCFVLQRITIVSGPDWVITCEHAATMLPESLGNSVGRAQLPFEEIREAVAARWPQVASVTSANLALLILRAIVDTYTNARRALRRWLEAWESSLYERLTAAPRGRTSGRAQVEDAITANDLLPLMELRRLRNKLFSRLETLNRPGMRTNDGLIWFSGGDPTLAEEVDEPLDRSLRGLRDFGEVLRSSVELVATFVAAEQSRQSERFQELATFIAAVLLVPTLVAGIYGANVTLPGKDRATGLWIMLAAMVLTATLTGLGMHYWRKRRNRTSRALAAR